jgi:6-phospho-3-hexuloisomerase
MTATTTTILRELGAVLALVSGEETEAFARAVLAADKVFVAGAGRSGLAAKAFAMRLVHFGLDAHVVGETTTPNYEPGDLLVIASGSGETGSLVAIAAKARRIGGTVALVTILPDSTVGRMADLLVRLPAPTPKADAGDVPPSIQPMGSLFEQSLLLFFDAIVLRLMELRADDTHTMFARHANLE